MKIPTRSLAIAVSLPALALSASPWGAPAPGSAVWPSPAALQEDEGGEEEPSGIAREDRQAKFRELYERAARLKAYDEMARLMKKYVNEAVYEVIDVCLAIERQERPELTDEIYAYDEGWRKAYPDSSFVMIVYEYFSLQSSPQRRERQRLQKLFNKANNELIANLESAEGPKFEQLAGEFEGYAQAFDELGDRYHASVSWNNVAICFDDRYRRKGADLDRAWEAYDKSAKYREMIELKDDYHQFARARQRQIEDEGYGPGAGSLGAEGDGGTAEAGEAKEPGEAAEPAPAAAAAPVPPVGPMRFEPIEKLDRYERPSYAMDEFHEIWPSMYFTAKGAEAGVHYMPDSPVFRREGDSSISIDVDGDGEYETPVPIRGGQVLTEVEVVVDGVPRPWAFVSRIGTEQDIYQGIQVNLQPAQDNFTLYYVNAASMVTDVGGTEVRIIDDNMDGRYGSYPTTWNYLGLAEGSSHPEMDSVIIGGGKRAVPWSQYQQIDGRWYEWESVEGGSRLSLKPAQFKTGKLELDYDGTDPLWLIVHGTDRVSGCYFDLAGAGRKGVEVPVGTYELYYGELRKGKRRQMQKAIILPGSGTSWTVRAGETTEVALGEPYIFQFDWRLEGETIFIPGKSIVVVGRGGEHYERLWNATPRPEVFWRQVGSRRGSKGEDMDVVMDQDVIYTPGGWERSWHPLDFSLDIGPVPEKGIEVQIVEKKNKLFGKVESAWRD